MNTPYASASLYVGDLANDITEGMLFEIFNQVGPVASIRVCRDAVTRRSLGYAYVNFHNVSDAERALDTLNSSLIKGRPCRVMWSQRDPSLRRSGVGNIFIKNLDRSIDHKALYDTFSAFGNILSCKVVTDETGQSKGYGFVHFETKEAAEKAIVKVNGMMLNNQKVFVGPFVTRKERLKTQDGEQKFTNVYVKNLDESVSTDQLRQVFGEFGTVTNAAVMMTDESGKSKGFGFVNFESSESAKKAVEALNAKDHPSLLHAKDKTLYVGRAQKKAERESELRAKFEALKLERLNKYQGVNLYVKNLEDSVDDDKLRSEFTPYGTITSCKVMKDEKGNSKGFGFVCYSTPEEATRSVTEMNGRIVGSKPLYVALAQRREVRKAQLEAQHAQRAKMRQNAPTMGPMYPPGTPVFYPQPGMPPQPGGFVGYPQQMMPRNNWRAQPQPGYQQVPHYVVNVAQRQQQHPSQRPPRGAGGQQGGIVSGAGGAGGPKDNRGPPNGRRAARNPPPNPSRSDIPPPVPQPLQQELMPLANLPIAPVTVPDAVTPLTLQLLQQFPVEQQRNIVGERVYPLIAKHQPELAGKITGMLLDSFYTEEMLQLIEDSNALYAKIQEAVEVLKQSDVQPVQ